MDIDVTNRPPATNHRSGAAVLVEARDLSRIWGRGSAVQVGVEGVNLDVLRGEVVALVGPSGSGKSTLGALLAGIDSPTAGSLVIDGVRIDAMKADALARWRGANVGIIFQDFHLLPTLTARENIELGLELGQESGRRSGRKRRKLADLALQAIGLTDKAGRLPSQLSGGEQQRVAIARAVAHQPRLLVADEPTGSLDRASGQVVFDLLMGLANTGTTVVFITHDPALASAADRVVHLEDGRVAAVESSCPTLTNTAGLALGVR